MELLVLQGGDHPRNLTRANIRRLSTDQPDQPGHDLATHPGSVGPARASQQLNQCAPQTDASFNHNYLLLDSPRRVLARICGFLGESPISFSSEVSVIGMGF